MDVGEKKGLSLVILGIVAVLAVVGLVLLFKSALTGGFSVSSNLYGSQKIYEATGKASRLEGNYVVGVPYIYTPEYPAGSKEVQYAGYWWPSPTYPALVGHSVPRQTSWQTAPCYPGQVASNPSMVEWWAGDTPCRMG
ncbi:MAG: hypothetical protein QW666_02695 [Candidatus Woesearchaeota archaeon]